MLPRVLTAVVFSLFCHGATAYAQPLTLDNVSPLPNPIQIQIQMQGSPRALPYAVKKPTCYRVFQKKMAPVNRTLQQAGQYFALNPSIESWSLQRLSAFSATLKLDWEAISPTISGAEKQYQSYQLTQASVAEMSRLIDTWIQIEHIRQRQASAIAVDQVYQNILEQQRNKLTSLIQDLETLESMKADLSLDSVEEIYSLPVNTLQ